MAASDVSIGDGSSLYAHPLREAVLGELHARPFTSIEVTAMMFRAFGRRAHAARRAERRERLAVGLRLCGSADEREQENPARRFDGRERTGVQLAQHRFAQGMRVKRAAVA
ncbi:MAG TPA: hypothetical protein VD867_01965 [Burkholderiales bacterium]|nr:hypothetical protein [Burkholderiales bacterium]